jgi:hypothetical protein
MAHRFLAFLLFGMLALAAFDGFEQRGQLAAGGAGDESGTVTAMDGPNPYPPVKKAY